MTDSAAGTSGAGNPLAGKRGMVLPGDGVVGRRPDALFLAVGPRSLLDRLFAAVERFDPAKLVAQALVFDWDGEGGGFVSLSVGADGVLTIEGAGSCDVLLDGRRIPIAEAAGAPEEPPTRIVGLIDRRAAVPGWVGRGEPVPGVERALSLTDGLVVGAGLILSTDESTNRIEFADRSSRSHDQPASASPPIPPSPASPPATPPMPGDPVGAAIETADRPPPVASGPADAGPADFEVFDLDGPIDEPRTPLPVTASRPPMPPGPPMPGADPADQSDPEPAGPQSADDATDDAVATVNGVLCPDGHFNHPEATSCVVCGATVDHRSGADVEGVRPGLGLLVVDDGTSYQLTRNYVVGRSPGEESGFEPIILDDEGISRTHARIVLDGWDVVLTDAGSKNGTGYRRSDADGWTRLEAEKPVTLKPGSSIDIGGRRTLTFEPLHDVPS